MNKERVEKLREGAAVYAAEKAAMRARRLIIGQWMLYRADEWNLVVQRGEEGEQFFYPDLPSAIRCLFRKMSEPAGKQTAAELAKHMDKCERNILEALGRAGDLGGLFGAEA